MDIIIILTQIILIVAFVIGYFLLKNSVPTYFSEKGKNLATKQDIEEITEKVKSIETKIKIKESGVIDYNSTIRRSILEYFSALNNWQRTITDSSADFSQDHKLKNEIIIERIKQTKFSYNLKEGEIELFIEDDNFYYLRKDLSIKILKSQHNFEEHCLKISEIYINCQDIDERRQKLLEELKRHQDLLVEKLKDLMPERNALIQFLDNTIKETFK